MPDVWFQTKDGMRGVARVSKPPRRRCSNHPCIRWALLSCDFPSLKRKSGSCDKPLCISCAVKKGENLDFCPHHPGDAVPGPAQAVMDL